MPIKSIADLLDSIKAFRADASDFLDETGLRGPFPSSIRTGRLLGFVIAQHCAKSFQSAQMLHYVITEAIAEFNRLHGELKLPGPPYPERGQPVATTVREEWSRVMDKRWLAKLIDECSALQSVAVRILALPPSQRPDEKSISMLEDRIAGVRATIMFVTERLGLDVDRIEASVGQQYTRFRAAGTEVSEVPQGEPRETTGKEAEANCGNDCG